MAKAIFITGCSRGIGLEMVKQLISSPKKPQHLFATCRNVEKAVELCALAKNHPEIHLKALDTTDESSYPSMVKWVEEFVGEDGLNILINNAGILTVDNFETVTAESMIEHFKTNTLGPLFLTKVFHPLLKKAANKQGGADGNLSASKACVLNMGSKLASLDDNTSSNKYAYRTSKTALNMVSKNLSLDLAKDGILVALVHPGWVITDMGGSNGLIDVKTSVQEILNTVSTLKKEQNGALLNYDGKVIPW